MELIIDTNIIFSALLDNYYLLLKNLQIIHENDISRESWQEASDLCADVDPKDTVYIAASMMLGADLWTGDKKLIKGLRQKGYDKTITTAELMTSL